MVRIGWVLLLALVACGTEEEVERQGPLPFAKNACERLVDHIEDCGVELTTTGVSDMDCDRGTPNACAAECGLRADCNVFVAPDDPTDPAFIDAVNAYAECIVDC